MKSIKKTYLYFLILIIVYIVFNFSWLPDPEIGNQFPFPAWAKNWINDKINLRTAVPFVFLGFFLELIQWQESKKPKTRIWSILFSLLIVLIAETGQLLLPKRHFDLRDIGYAIIGTIVGMLLAYIYNRLK